MGIFNPTAHFIQEGIGLMAKNEIIQGAVGSIRRRCIICGERWDAGHPNDPNTLFCPECLEKLKLMLKEKSEC